MSTSGCSASRAPATAPYPFTTFTTPGGSVRHMIAQLPEDDVAPHLWTTLAGRPRLHRDELRGAAH
ncbi:hypothetical protein Scel_80650 [Streptomyces cellostaticus]|nr:hypothetical protein Scel_80650 [Streptomyces cellostaticus]